MTENINKSTGRTDCRPVILLTNDDGVDAKGIRSLAEAAGDLGQVVIVAPDSPRSGQSAAITVNAPLRLKRHADMPSCGAHVYSVNGTPADCVKLALHILFGEGRTYARPSLLLSGINHGSNSAVSVVYSGTMGAVAEGCLNGIPSAGMSLLDYSPDADFSVCRATIRRIAGKLLEHGLPAGLSLNVNFPAHREPAGLKVVRAARGRWTEEYLEYTAPDGRPFYMLTGHFQNCEPDCDLTDEYWLSRGYATVVPTRVDYTEHTAIAVVEQLLD